MSASLLLFVPRPAPEVDHDPVAGTEEAERSLVIGSFPENRAVCKGVKDAWGQGGFSLPTVLSRRREGLRGRIMRLRTTASAMLTHTPCAYRAQDGCGFIHTGKEMW